MEDYGGLPMNPIYNVTQDNKIQVFSHPFCHLRVTLSLALALQV